MTSGYSTAPSGSMAGRFTEPVPTVTGTVTPPGAPMPFDAT